MKKILFVALALFFANFSSFAQTSENADGTSKQEKESKVEIIYLSKAEFLKNVADFEASPQTWTYLGDKPAIIDFYADWCAPCRMLSPVLEQLLNEYKGAIYVYKINVDKEKEISDFFKIQSIPCLLFVPMKGDPKSLIGLRSHKELKDKIDVFLLKK